MRWRSPFAIGSVLVALLMAGCGSRAAPGPSSSAPPSVPTATAAPAQAATSASALAPSSSASTAAAAQVRVAACPVPAADYAGTPYSPRAAPAMLSLPAALPLPQQARIFGTTFLPGSTSYLLGPESAACRGTLASADGGEIMTAAQAGRSAGLTMIIRPGGVGPSTDLACPYIPAVLAADEAFRQGHVFCAHPPADVIRQIPTGTAGLYAAAVLVPARVKDPNIAGSGDGTDPSVALYTAEAGSDYASGQTISCTLAPAQQGICAASLKFYLATQAQIGTRISAARLGAMEAALASFLADPARDGTEGGP